MSAAEIGAKPPNTTRSPYRNMAVMQTPNDAKESSKRCSVSNETQYWRYDASNKRQKQGAENQGRLLCFKFTSSGTCPQGDKCNFMHDPEAREQFARNVCFDFLNKGKCERGTSCKFSHSLSDDRTSASRNARSARSVVSSFCVFFFIFVTGNKKCYCKSSLSCLSFFFFFCC